MGLPRIGKVFLLLAVLASCRRPPERASAPAPSPSTPPPAAPSPVAPSPAEAPRLPAPPPPPPPAQVERFAVPGDLDASIVRALDGRAPLTVFVPGICSNANAYLQGFPEAARRQGGVVGIEGDGPCGGNASFRTFSWDAAKLHARIEKALTAAGVEAIPPEGITLVGYSQGAALGEQLAARWPARYTRLVVIGAPTDPSPASFARSRGVVMMSCARDVPARMRDASKKLARVGVPSTYVEMPGCTHGNLTDGDRVFDEAFDFLRDR